MTLRTDVTIFLAVMDGSNNGIGWTQHKEKNKMRCATNMNAVMSHEKVQSMESLKKGQKLHFIKQPLFKEVVRVYCS